MDPNFAGKLNMHMHSQNKDTLKNLQWLLLVLCVIIIPFPHLFSSFAKMNTLILKEEKT